MRSSSSGSTSRKITSAMSTASTIGRSPLCRIIGEAAAAFNGRGVKLRRPAQTPDAACLRACIAASARHSSNTGMASKAVPMKNNA